MTILIVAPHPDDEIWGTGGLLIQSQKNKEKVTVVYITTGALRNENKQKEKLREEAVKKIGVLLGIKQIFLRYPERSLIEKNTAIKVKNSLEKIIKKEKPNKIFVTAYEGGHPDHDICNFIVSKIKTNAQKYEYCMYNNRFGIFKAANIARREITKKLTRDRIWWDKSSFIKPWLGNGKRLKMSSDEIKQKNVLFYHYQLTAEKPLGQMRINIGSFPKDLFRKFPDHDYLKKPHLIFPLNYELAFKIRFEKLRQLFIELRNI